MGRKKPHCGLGHCSPNDLGFRAQGHYTPKGRYCRTLTALQTGNRGANIYLKEHIPTTTQLQLLECKDPMLLSSVQYANECRDKGASKQQTAPAKHRSIVRYFTECRWQKNTNN